MWLWEQDKSFEIACTKKRIGESNMMQHGGHACIPGIAGGGWEGGEREGEVLNSCISTRE